MATLPKPITMPKPSKPLPDPKLAETLPLEELAVVRQGRVRGSFSHRITTRTPIRPKKERVMGSPVSVLRLQNLLYEKKGPIAYVTINRPLVLNSLNRQTIAELREVFEDARDDSAVGAVILTGAGEKAFAAGADIRELVSQTAAQAEEATRFGQGVTNLIENLGKPVAAAIRGFALGGGCEIAMACTFRIAAESAKFGQPEVKLGIMPGYGGSQRLPRLVGKGRALQIILSGEIIAAQEAYRIGLVNEVVSSAKLIARVEEILIRMIANAPLSVKFSLEAVNRGMETSLAEGLILEASLFALCVGREDKTKGTSAFLGEASTAVPVGSKEIKNSILRKV